MRSLAVAAALCLSGPLAGQVSPQPGEGDPRLQSIEYQADQIVRISASVGYVVTIELAPDEQIQTVAVGDPSAFHVSTNNASDRLFVKPLQTGATTNMTVFTSARSYGFDLDSGSQVAAATYTVRFRYPRDASQMPHAMNEQKGTYRLQGDKRLWPAAISDDGLRTYIEWPADVPLPATYIVDEGGTEALANGNMREGLYVIDSVNARLVFRIDNRTGRASRRELNITR